MILSFMELYELVYPVFAINNKLHNMRNRVDILF